MRRRGGEEEQATDIKSNNPHLAGGEKSFFYWNNEDFTNERIGQPSRIEISPCKLDWEFIDANRLDFTMNNDELSGKKRNINRGYKTVRLAFDQAMQFNMRNNYR